MRRRKARDSQAVGVELVACMLKNVQALRAIAAMLVILDHVSYELFKSDPGGRTLLDGFRYIGQFGVDLFFVISGFIMVTTSWNAFGRPGVSRTFVLRRLARIYPPYWIVLSPIVLAYALAAHQFLHRVEGQADIFASIALLPSSHPRLLDISWTLTYELSFYGVFAVVLTARRSLLLPLLGCWVVLQLIAMWLWHGSGNPYLSFLGTPLPLEFIMGACVGYFYRSGKMPSFAFTGVAGIVAATLVWIASALPEISMIDLSKRDIVRILQFGIPAACIIYGAVGWEVRRASFAPPWLVGLGDASYSMYLWHVPVSLVLGALFARAHVHGIVGNTFAQAITIAVILGVSVSAYRFFERPITTWLNALIGVAHAPVGENGRRPVAAASIRGE